MQDSSARNNIEEFFNKYPKKVFAKREIILRPAQKVKSIFYIVTGTVRLYAISESGEELTLHFFKKGSFIPVMTILSDQENRYFFEAVTKVESLVAPSEKVIELLKNDKEILFDLTRRLSEGISGFLIRTEYLMSTNAYTKVASLLLYMANRFPEKRKGDSMEKVINFAIPLTHHDIASWLGLSRETASRQLERLTKEGIISTNNHQITILHLEELKRVHSAVMLDDPYTS